MLCVAVVPGFCLVYARAIYDGYGSGACDSAATWLQILAGIQLAQILHLFCVKTLAGKIKNWSYKTLPCAESQWLFGYPAIALYFAHLAFAVYGCVTLTANRGEYHGCPGLSNFAQAYAWFTLTCSMVAFSPPVEENFCPYSL